MGAAISYGIEKSSEGRLPPLDGTISLPALGNTNYPIVPRCYKINQIIQIQKYILHFKKSLDFQY